ncbi:MAG: undecaprenyl-phosphate glucose phosphotransferase [Myxococcota bacterium]
MLNRHSEIFRTLLVMADLAWVAVAWLGAFGLRFHAGIPAPLGKPPAMDYVSPLLLILPLYLMLFRSHGLYAPRRIDSALGEAGAVLRACTLGLITFTALTFFMRTVSYSRGVVALFAVLAPLAVLGFRSAVRFGLRAARRRGFNLRFVLLVGAGPLAEKVVRRIDGRPDAGMRVLGVVAEGALGGQVEGAPIIGGYGGLGEILRTRHVDQVIVALSRHEADVFEKVMAELQSEVVNVKIVPDLAHGLGLHSTIESLDGLPVIGLQETPLMGWGALVKRVFDVFASATALVLLAPLFLGVTAAIAATMGRPILHKQKRMGHDGRVFEMLKFRSMRRDAEAKGPGWTLADDPRRTALGRWLRRFNLDELPQLWNVLRGEMSLVGPRPEQPTYIETFRQDLPGYMLRHKVRAGMTGWAQVYGWRGDTSIQERLEHDLYYIQKWSFGLDFRILLMTLFQGGRNAKAMSDEEASLPPSEDLIPRETREINF